MCICSYNMVWLTYQNQPKEELPYKSIHNNCDFVASSVKYVFTFDDITRNSIRANDYLYLIYHERI